MTDTCDIKIILHNYIFYEGEQSYIGIFSIILRDGLDIYRKWEICEYQEHSKVNTNVAQFSLT